MSCYFPEPYRTGRERWLDKTADEKDQIRFQIALQLTLGLTFGDAVLEVVKDEEMWDYLVNTLVIHVD